MAGAFNAHEREGRPDSAPRIPSEKTFEQAVALYRAEAESKFRAGEGEAERIVHETEEAIAGAGTPEQLAALQRSGGALRREVATLMASAEAAVAAAAKGLPVAVEEGTEKEAQNPENLELAHRHLEEMRELEGRIAAGGDKKEVEEMRHRHGYLAAAAHNAIAGRKTQREPSAPPAAGVPAVRAVAEFERKSKGAMRGEHTPPAPDIAAAERAERLSSGAAIAEKMRIGFGARTLAEQEGLLMTFDQAFGATLEEANRPPAGVPGNAESAKRLIGAWHEMREAHAETLKRFWNAIEETGMSREEYAAAVVGQGLRVGELMTLAAEHPERCTDRLLALGKVVAKLRPQPIELTQTVDDFLKSTIAFEGK